MYFERVDLGSVSNQKLWEIDRRSVHDFVSLSNLLCLELKNDDPVTRGHAPDAALRSPAR